MVAGPDSLGAVLSRITPLCGQMPLQAFAKRADPRLQDMLEHPASHGLGNPPLHGHSPAASNMPEH
eukprot:1414376-Karenia_brevis.AAC.1